MTSLASLRASVNVSLQKAVTGGDFGPKNRLRDGCEYVLTSSGKRWRPVLVLAIAEALGAPAPTDAANSIECIHTASLIVDDLPVFDNDSVRRGKAALHMVFGEMIAQLTAVSLMGAAFRLLAQSVRNSGLSDADSRGMLLVQSFADNIGAMGAAGGQFLDSWPNGLQDPAAVRDDLKRAPPEPVELQKILHQKTSTFFEIAMVTGWVLGGGKLEKLGRIIDMAAAFGLGFQIADDFRDIDQDLIKARATGLPSTNYILNFGPKQATDTFVARMKEFIQTAEELGIFSPALREMVHTLLDVVKDVPKVIG